jgi:hypothetical protein
LKVPEVFNGCVRGGRDDVLVNCSLWADYRSERAMSKKPPRLRAIAGGRAATTHTLVLEVRAFDDPTTAMQASVKALGGPQDTPRPVSVATARELLTD